MAILEKERESSEERTKVGEVKSRTKICIVERDRMWLMWSTERALMWRD